MTSHHQSDSNSQPCRHVEPFLQAVASKRAGPFARWYALAHSARCTRCKEFLDRLTALVEGLQEGREQATDSNAVARLRAKVRKPAP
jgi:NADH:ubiquinone oxidoreductase subunit F (NADH-binding)